MGSCGSKEKEFDNVQPQQHQRPSNDTRHRQQNGNRPSTNRSRPSSQSGNRPSNTRPSSRTSNGHPNEANKQSRNKSSSSRSTAQSSRHHDKKSSKEHGVSFADFKDREKNVVESILVSNNSLKFASVNFEDLKLQKIIGTGAFGEVIKGTLNGTPVVVKRMLRNKIDESHLRMFAEEIQLMMNLRHPNIVQFIGGSWNSFSNVCFVTEFLERGDLFTVLRNPSYQLSWQEPILRMMIDTSRGMAYLHGLEPQIIHRDLKSMNILVSSTFGCKVSDFGLSREKSVDETMSVTGTPLWLPPEMIRGERYSEKADVYSFGIVMSEFDTRKIPYHDIKAKGARHKKVSGSTLMHMVAYENLRPSLSQKCLKSVADLYERCTANDPSLRPSFTEICSELEGKIRDEIFSKSSEEIDNLLEEDGVSAEELGVTHATKYTEDD